MSIKHPPAAFAACAALALLIQFAAFDARATRPAREAAGDGHVSAARESDVAAAFAPVFQQGLGDDPRFDYITNFDFDGDWRGDNNWSNAADPKYQLRAHVYYAVSETSTHYFIHYAVFHPRDYKGGGLRGAILSEAIREGVRRGGKYDPTGLSGEAVLAHENDMEGCLVVAEKNGVQLSKARVVFVETLAHNRFLKYEAGVGDRPERVSLEGQRAKLYVEPKGHGISRYVGGPDQSPRRGIVVYEYTGRADAPSAEPGDVGYALVPLGPTLWHRARGGTGHTYGAAHDYGKVSIKVIDRSGKASVRQLKVGKVGSAFLGAVGASNMARPPWGWFDQDDREPALGSWFFDPASTVKRHFKLGEDFSIAYLNAPIPFD